MATDAPPDPTRQAAQRLLAQIADGAWLTVEEAADVRLVAEAVMEARSAENAETCAKVDSDPTAAERAWAALWRAKARDLRIDGKRIYELFCAKHDSETDLLTANDELARRKAALQAEVVRLREALEAVCDFGDRAAVDIARAALKEDT